MNKINNTNSLSTAWFGQSYQELTKYMVDNGTLQKSRAGDTMELLNFKTTIQYPNKRCVGGFGRNINIFFLLQEAIWIWLGKKDLESLAIFNSNMKNFSDDGKTFHAPYGFRLRNYGVPSDLDLFLKQSADQKRGFVEVPMRGMDQIKQCVQMLSDNSEDRRVVASIWNPNLDLNFKCKDIPCNDMLMFKVRNKQLHLTIQNRSNDLHWGLPTNVFQFSFILEALSNAIDIEVGTQTHNSQSLHVYLSNPITLSMMGHKSDNELYNLGYKEDEMDFAYPEFEKSSPENRLKFIDSVMSDVFDIVMRSNTGEEISESDLDEILLHSKYFYNVLKLLLIYVKYSKSEKNDESRIKAIEDIVSINTLNKKNDLRALAINFFIQRVEDKDSLESFEGSDLNDFKNQKF